MGPYNCSWNIGRAHAILMMMPIFFERRTTLTMQLEITVLCKKHENPTCMERSFIRSSHSDPKKTWGTFCLSFHSQHWSQLWAALHQFRSPKYLLENDERLIPAFGRSASVSGWCGRKIAHPIIQRHPKQWP